MSPFKSRQDARRQAVREIIPYPPPITIFIALKTNGLQTFEMISTRTNTCPQKKIAVFANFSCGWGQKRLF
jgi:hypothetical protein